MYVVKFVYFLIFQYLHLVILPLANSEPEAAVPSRSFLLSDLFLYGTVLPLELRAFHSDRLTVLPHVILTGSYFLYQRTKNKIPGP